MKERALAGMLVRRCFLRSTLASGVVVALTSSRAFSQQTVMPSPGTSLGIRSVPNLRDLGGYKTQDGLVVRYGIAYRSNQLAPVTPDDIRKIAALGLKTDFDLRTAVEREERPDEIPPGVEKVWLNVLADDKTNSAAEVQALLGKPLEANKVLGDGKAELLFIEGYREFVTLPSAKKSYHDLFAALSTASNGPALFHCTTGKDRTGWAAAALLTLLGVPEQQVYADFLRSNEYIIPAYQGSIDRFVAAGGDPSIPQDILGVKAAYLKASFETMHAQYGTIESYFANGLGIDKAAQQRLRDRFLTKG